MKNKAIFLDRDGVINVEIHYLHEPEKFVFTEKVIDACKLFLKNNYRIFVVTNQGAISKGIYMLKDMQDTHDHMLYLFRKNDILISEIFYCPHSSEENCDCRKPKPGMVLKGINKYNIDANNSWMIGDKLSDIEAGNRAGLNTILVRTGYGKEHEELIMKKKCKEIEIPKEIVNNLFEASYLITNTHQN